MAADHAQRAVFMRRAFSVSRIIGLVVTGRCETACGACPLPCEKVSEAMPVAVAERAIQGLKNAGGDAVAILGGDPFAYPGLADVLGIVAKLDGWATIVCGRTPGEDVYPLLERHRNDIQTLWVGFDGMASETHDRRRGDPGGYQRAQALVLWCLRQRISVGVELACHPETPAEAEAFFQYYQSLGLRKGMLHLAPPRTPAAGLAAPDIDRVRDWVFGPYWPYLRHSEFFRICHPAGCGWQGCYGHVEHAPVHVGPNGKLTLCRLGLRPGEPDLVFLTPERDLVDALLELDGRLGGPLARNPAEPDYLNQGRYPIPCPYRFADAPGRA